MKYNRLIYELTGSIEKAISSEALSGRCMGKTTGEIMILIGEALSNPNKRFSIQRISDYNKYGSSYKYWLFEQIKNLVCRFNLKGFYFYRTSMEIEYKAYGNVKINYEIID